MAERNLDFDKVVDRKNTSCLKYDFAVKRGMPADILPLWVADMDFKTSSYIQDAVAAQAEHGIYGYTESGDSYFEAVQSWFFTHSLYSSSSNAMWMTEPRAAARSLDRILVMHSLVVSSGSACHRRSSSRYATNSTLLTISSFSVSVRFV